jgi:hypothetical protein
MRDGHPKSDEDEPEDVSDGGRGTSSGSADHGPAEWPKDVCRETERCDTKWNGNDEDAHQDARHYVRNEEPNPRKDQPEQIQDDAHWPSLSWGSGRESIKSQRVQADGLG